jgi:hypothetical protein
MTSSVILGPGMDLHFGIHASLMEAPPAGFRYQMRDARHVFLFRGERSSSPFRDAHAAELVDFGPGPELVHTARWPVVNRHSWVTDMDDLGFPLLAGRHVWNPQFRRRFRAPHSRQFHDAIRDRVEAMLAAYNHPSCRAILFRTRAGLATAGRLLRDWQAGVQWRKLRRKCRVLYPAQRPFARARVREKWRDLLRGTIPLRVVFCGIDYDAKNGALALELFGRLMGRTSRLTCAYVGLVPQSELRRHRVAFHDIDYHPQLSRARMLSLFECSHVLFHPAAQESFGMVLLEAAAAGMAVVAAHGPLTPHFDEILDPRGALMLDRFRPSRTPESEAFWDLLMRLVEDPAAAHAMGMHNYVLTTRGKFSCGRRNKILKRLYSRAVAYPARGVLRWEDLPGSSRWKPIVWETVRVFGEEQRFRRLVGERQQNIYF